MTATDRKRRGAPLKLVFFAVTGLLTVLAAGLAIGLTLVQGERLSDVLVEDALERARAAENDVLASRFRELELVTQLIADDPSVSTYVAEATGGGLFGGSDVGLNSLVDQLDELRQRIGFDLGMVLGMDGELLVHSERPVGANEWLGDDPLIATLIDELVPVSGYRQEGDESYQIVMVPMAKAGSLIGFLAAGLLVDDAFAADISRISGTEIILLANDESIASTLAPAQTADVLKTFSDGEANVARPITIADERWVAIVETIDAESDPTIASISLISTDRVLAPYRELLTFLLVGGGALVLMALGLSLWISSRMASPLTRLASAAEGAAGGEYDRAFPSTGGVAELNTLGTAFSSLMSELREKRDMQEYVSDLYRYLPDPGIEETRAANQTRPGEATRDALHLLALEYRRVSDGDQKIEDLVGEFENLALALSARARTCTGQLEVFEGQRAVLTFSGPRSLERALVFAGLLDEDATPPAVALVAGQVGRATIRVGGSAHRLMVGRAVLQADLLLEESQPGTLLSVPGLKEKLAAIVPVSASGLHAQAGRLSGKKYVALDLAGIAQAQLELPPKAGTGQQLTNTVQVETGDLFADRYEIVSILGRGGMGVVYKAFDRELEDFVALKTLLPEISADTHYLDQLKEEIKLARRITHPNVLRTFDFGQSNNVPYISMEYVRGMTLRYLLEQRKRLPFSAGLRIARQLAAALAAAHEQDVVHRDVKPENIILHASGNAKLMDFGIASPMQRLDGGTGNVFVGTPSYASPEQMEGKPLDKRADIYACGVLMYQVFSGQMPFSGDMMGIYMAKTQQSFAPFSDVTDASAAALIPVVDCCLQADPSERYASADELMAALGALRG